VSLENTNGVTVDWVTYPVLFIYSWPIIAIVVIGVSTDFFAINSRIIVAFSQILLNPNWENARTVIGSIVMPFLTAYSITVKPNISTIVALRTYSVFITLVGLLVAVFAAIGLIEYGADSLKRYSLTQKGVDTDISAYQVLAETCWVYVFNLLAYVALVLGVSLARPTVASDSVGP